MEMLDAGFGNSVPKTRITAIVSYDWGPVNRHCRELESKNQVIDATKGRKVRTVIYLDSGQAILSHVARETLCKHLEQKSQSPS